MFSDYKAKHLQPPDHQWRARISPINASWDLKCSIQQYSIVFILPTRSLLKTRFSPTLVQLMKLKTLLTSLRLCKLFIALHTYIRCDWVSDFSASTDLRALSRSQRKCLFYDESEATFPGYNVNLCRLKCHAEEAIKLCGCRPHFYYFISELNCHRCNW